MVEGAPHTVKTMINLCVYGVPPSPVYKEVEEGRLALSWRALGGSPTPGGSRIPPSLVGVGEKRRGRERGWLGQAARPLLLSPNRTRKGGGAPLPFPLSHSFLPPPSGTRKGESYPH